MKVFYVLSLNHKFIKELNDVFLFHDINYFCYFAEIINLKKEWDISYNTNTKNINDYISVLNTDIKRKFLVIPDDELEYIENIDEVDEYYNDNYDLFDTTVESYLNDMKESLDKLDNPYHYDKENEHKIHFINGLSKNFYSIDSLQFFIERMKMNNVNTEYVQIQINPEKVTFEEYMETIMLFDSDSRLPNEVVDLESLNYFLNGLSDLRFIDSYFEELEVNEKKKLVKNKKRRDKMNKNNEIDEKAPRRRI